MSAMRSDDPCSLWVYQVQSRCFAEKDLPHWYRYGCPFDDPDGVVLKSLRRQLADVCGPVLLRRGQGFVASQSSNIIAGAVNARDAQQSSGIQTATRNVGQAIGVAILA